MPNSCGKIRSQAAGLEPALIRKQKIMTDTTLEENQTNERYLAAKAKHTLLMWLLLCGGLILVCFANPLGQLLVPKEYAGTSVGWNPDDVREIAFVLRILGVMVFAAGLVERLILSMKYDRVITAT